MIVRSKAPLRLGFGGGGTDLSPYCELYGGLVINATINMYAHCSITTTSDNRIVFDCLDIGEHFDAPASAVIEPKGECLLLKGVYNRVVKDFNGGQPLSLHVSTYADAPVGSGLGTSSTMVVAILKAFIELLKLPLGEYDAANLAYQIERIDLKLDGGKQDQYAATFGGFNFIEFGKDNKVIVNPLRIREWIKDELEASLVLYYTGRSRESAKIIDEQIKSTQANANHGLEAMHQIKAIAVQMKEHLLKGDIEGMAKDLNEAWEAKKKTSSAISNPSIDRIYKAAMKAGASAGKISGAGGGGYMFFLVNPEKKYQVISELSKPEYGGRVDNVEFVDKGTKGWFLS
jgi:D-glycero-alpha-D-manno-heptose-7-phosphate kinase